MAHAIRTSTRRIRPSFPVAPTGRFPETDVIEARLAPEPGRCCVVITADLAGPRPKARWPLNRSGG